jgi:Zn-dependent protease
MHKSLQNKWKEKERNRRMNCQKCGQETFLPFQCPYCGGKFCTAHRLPENHACPKIELAHESRQKAVVYQSPKSYEYSVTFGQPRMPKRRVYFSPKELKHLMVAGLLVMSIGLSSILYSSFLSSEQWIVGLSIFGVFGVVLAASFFAHEIAHKVTAQKRGLWAEFRLTMWGAILTLISVISPLFKIISPGAVVVSGSATTEEMGKISLAGPSTNIVLSVVLLGAAPATASSSAELYMVFLFAAFLNGFMAVFNLIPFGILDGFKIFNWNKKVWSLAFAASLALTIVAYVFVQGLVG